MLDRDAIANKTKSLEEISEIKQYLSLIEHEINASDHVERWSNDDIVQNIWRKLRAATNYICNASCFLAWVTDDEELKRKLVDLDLKITHEQFGGAKKEALLEHYR